MLYLRQNFSCCSCLMKIRSCLILLLFFAFGVFQSRAQDFASWLSKLRIPQMDTVSVIFLGDIMQHGQQLTAAKTKEGYDYLPCFAALAPRLKAADLSVVNIETAFAGAPYTGYPVFSSPDALISDLKTSGVQLFLTANNHICDQGQKGLVRSLDLFDSTGILHTGTFRSPVERSQRYPLVVERKGIRIAFLCYSYGTNGFAVPAPFVVNLIDTATIAKDILHAQQMRPDFIVACMHWGEEYKEQQSAHQKMLARFLTRNGVDIVIGAHPHVPQGMEVVRLASGEIKNIIAYSLGNVVSNMTLPNTQIGLLAEIKFMKHGFYKAIASFGYEWIATEHRYEGGIRKFYLLPIDQCTRNSASVSILPDGSARPSLYFKTDTLPDNTITFKLKPY